MLTAIVFSITGLSVLDLGRAVSQSTNVATETMQAQVKMESLVNVAMWRLNTGSDSLGNYSSGPLSSSYDTTHQILSVQYNDGVLNTGYSLDLSEDSHFKRAIATTEYLYTGRYSVNEESEHRLRENFHFLPEADMSFWMSQADSVYTGSDRYFFDGDLIDGVLVFTGSHIRFQNISLDNSTMIFTGNDIDFYQNSSVTAYQSGETVYPALVFTDSSTVFWVNEWFSWRKDRIKGAIYSAGTIVLRTGELTGPVVGRRVYLYRDMNFIDDQYPAYYQWPVGFGSYDDYDWPKQITKWEQL